MAIIRKIKLPGEQEPRDIGTISSNVIYDGDSGVTTTLNEKIQSIFTAIGDINSFEIALVNTLPTEDIDDHTIYFVPNAQDANVRDEYMYVGNTWEMIGSTTIDLSDYPTYDDITVTQGLTTGIPAATITVGATTTTIYSADANSLTPTLDNRYVNVIGDIMTGTLDIKYSGYTGIRFKAPSSSEDQVQTHKIL